MWGKSTLSRVRMHFELMPKDPYKGREVVHIEVKQVGIPRSVQVRTPNNNKTFRKDRYGYFRFVAAPIGRSTRNGTKRKPNKERMAYASHN